MTPIFKCLICRKDIERSTKTFWKKKGHLLCSTCLDEIEKKSKKKVNQFRSAKINEAKELLENKKNPGVMQGFLSFNLVLEKL